MENAKILQMFLIMYLPISLGKYRRINCTKLKSYESHGIAGNIIEPPGYTSLYKGDYWGPWKRCRKGTRVKGMKLRIEKNQRTGDDTALNAIRLTCTDGKVLKSKEG